MKNALSRERFCVYRSRKSRKARENEKVHVSVPKSRGVPKVVCLRGCVPKEQQGVKIRTFQPSHQTFFEGLPKNPKNFAKKLYVVGVQDYAESFEVVYLA